MAGGIDWFRWHHGSVTDPKFQLIAKKAGVRLPDVLAVWAFVLEKASASEQRGEFGDLDFESIDCLFGLEDGGAAQIFEHMEVRALVAAGRVAAWDKRQPKRERDPAPTPADAKPAKTSTERSRDHRARKAGEAPSQAMQRHATPCNASNDQETPRGEESREELLPDEAKASSSSPGATNGRPQVPCQYQAIVDAYHQALPMLPRVKLMDDKRKAAMRKFWGWVLGSEKPDGSRRATTGDEAVAWLRDYFGRAACNTWLTGQEPSRSHPGWKADFDFLLSDKGLKAVIERTEVAA